MNTLTICWAAIGTMVAIIGGSMFLYLLVDWASETEWGWKKIVGISVLSISGIVLLILLYMALATIFCK